MYNYFLMIVTVVGLTSEYFRYRTNTVFIDKLARSSQNFNIILQ